MLVAFFACATAYAFFQVPFVAMPAELTDDYDERTRLMTWRVALLALTILLTGASAPLIRDAVGGRDGYRLMGLAMAVVITIGVVVAFALLIAAVWASSVSLATGLALTGGIVLVCVGIIAMVIPARTARDRTDDQRDRMNQTTP